MPIIGHENILSFFERAIENKKIAHAYLFVGPESVGKRTVTEWLSQKLLGAVKGEGLHPDLCIVGRAVDPKTEKIKKNISIDQAREVISFLSLAPFYNGYKVAIIEDAHLLSVEAANALLKSLEEPPPSAVLILLAERISDIPETVVSRAQMLRFRPVAGETIVRALESQGIARDTADEIAAAADHRPGRALRFCRDPESFAQWKKERQEFLEYARLPLSARMAKAQKMVKGADARENAQRIIELWLGLTHIEIANSRALPVSFFDAALHGQQLLEQNVSPKLVMGSIMLSL